MTTCFCFKSHAFLVYFVNLCHAIGVRTKGIQTTERNTSQRNVSGNATSRRNRFMSLKIVESICDKYTIIIPSSHTILIIYLKITRLSVIHITLTRVAVLIHTPPWTIIIRFTLICIQIITTLWTTT